jgi:hypothetical protein
MMAGQSLPKDDVKDAASGPGGQDRAAIGLGIFVMRRLAVLLLALCALAWPAAASARVVVHIDKSSQRMTVSHDGAMLYVWPVSTGRAPYGTPVGRFRPQMMMRSYFSRKYYGSPMPHSIFFYRGYAIHGTNYISRLGGPASHGCIRLHPAAAATLFALVQRAGAGNTDIIITH